MRTAKVRKIPDISQQPGLKITNLKLITNEKHFAGAKISKSPESYNSGGLPCLKDGYIGCARTKIRYFS